ncbi:hypothetical protein D3C71_1505070 [compost metagenome]
MHRRLLPAPRHQQTKGQCGKHIERVGIGNEHPVGNFAGRTKQQHPAQITPLTACRDCRRPREVRRHRQAKPRKRQPPRHIQPIGGVTDISQVIEDHAQQRQPLEQIQCTVTLSHVHNWPASLYFSDSDIPCAPRMIFGKVRTIIDHGTFHHKRPDHGSRP